MALTLSTWALDRRPCFVCTAMTRALPSVVRGPVDLPPCSLQRLRFFNGRVLARPSRPGLCTYCGTTDRIGITSGLVQGTIDTEAIC